MNVYDELRGMVLDLPVGKILPGWVQKAAVIEAIDRFEEERASEGDPECPTCATGGHVVPRPHRIATPVEFPIVLGPKR